MSDVIVVIGPGQIGQAIARRVGVGKHLLLADKRLDNANAAAETLANAGYEVSVATVDVSSRQDVHSLVEKATIPGRIRPAILTTSRGSQRATLTLVRGHSTRDISM